MSRKQKAEFIQPYLLRMIKNEKSSTHVGRNAAPILEEWTWNLTTQIGEITELWEIEHGGNK